MSGSLNTSLLRRLRAFTLIELMIVIAIILILAAIAVPRYFEAQTRSQVSRVKAELRSLATAIESYRIDHREYPPATSDPAAMSLQVASILGPLASGFSTLNLGGKPGQTAGIDFHALTTPMAYISSVPFDPFAEPIHESAIPYGYLPTTRTRDGWVLSSVGPDRDFIAPDGRGNANTANPLSTAADPLSPAGIADLNERAVIEVMEGSTAFAPADRSSLNLYLADLTYDPTNGAYADGDVLRTSGGSR